MSGGGDYPRTTTVTNVAGSVTRLVTEVIELTTVARADTTTTITATSILSVGGGLGGTSVSAGSGSVVASGNSSSYYITSSSSSPVKPSSKSPAVLQSGNSLSTGAKAGIGVGIIIALAAIIGILILLRIRRRRSKGLPEIAAEESKASDEKIDASRGASKKWNALPTWESELSGEAQRAELDANDESKRTELDGARSPAELDANGLSVVERPQTTADEDVGGTEDKTPGEPGGIDVSKPPPIPYASKPRPG